MIHSGWLAYGHTRMRAPRRSMPQMFAFAILGLALIATELSPAQTSTSDTGKVPIAIYGTFFDEEDQYPADLSVVAKCTNSQMPLSLITQEQTSEGTPKELYFLEGHFKDGTCTLIYRSGNKAVLTIPNVPIRNSRTTAVAVLMHKAPTRPTLFIDLQELRYTDKPHGSRPHSKNNEPLGEHSLRRFACVSASRAQHDAQIYTKDGDELARSLSRECSQRTTTEVEQQPASLKPELASLRGARPPEEDQGQSLGMGLA